MYGLTTEASSGAFQQEFKLLFGVNEKLLTQHISGPVTKYKLFKSATRVGQGLGLGLELGLGLRVSARG